MSDARRTRNNVARYFPGIARSRRYRKGLSSTAGETTVLPAGSQTVSQFRVEASALSTKTLNWPTLLVPNF